MIEPLPLALSERLLDVSAFFLATKLPNALLVVMPMSKQRPFTEYLSVCTTERSGRLDRSSPSPRRYCRRGPVPCWCRRSNRARTTEFLQDELLLFTDLNFRCRPWHGWSSRLKIEG